MSESAQTSASAMPAERIREMAAEWLIRRRDGEDLSDADQQRLDRWLAESSAHMVAYWRLEEMWSQADRLSALRRPAEDKPSRKIDRRAWRMLFRGIAAVVVVSAIGADLGSYLLSPRAQIYETPLGGHEILTLKDGSHVELNTDTILRIADSAEREVWLDRGEAYFEVRHDAKRPFIVTIGNHRVTDLGTKFVLRRDDERLQVAVIEGNVRFNPGGAAAQNHATVLSAGDVAIATADTVTVSKKTAIALTEELGWRTGVLVFHHTTLGEAAEEFNRYNQERLIIADGRVAKLRVGGTFPTNNVQGFAESAKEILGLRVETREGETLISR